MASRLFSVLIFELPLLSAVACCSDEDATQDTPVAAATSPEAAE